MRLYNVVVTLAETTGNLSRRRRRRCKGRTICSGQWTLTKFERLQELVRGNALASRGLVGFLAQTLTREQGVPGGLRRRASAPPGSGAGGGASGMRQSPAASGSRSSAPDEYASLVSTKELGSMLYAAIQNPTKAEIKEMVFELDPKMIGNKTVDFTTYVSRRLKEYDTEEELREAFKVFDKEQNGQIIGNELKESLMTLGEPFSEEEITNLCKNAKMNAEGVINYEGLIKMMMKK